jgi:hypothetical protein
VTRAERRGSARPPKQTERDLADLQPCLRLVGRPPGRPDRPNSAELPAFKHFHPRRGQRIERRTLHATSAASISESGRTTPIKHPEDSRQSEKTHNPSNTARQNPREPAARASPSGSHSRHSCSYRVQRRDAVSSKGTPDTGLLAGDPALGDSASHHARRPGNQAIRKFISVSDRPAPGAICSEIHPQKRSTLHRDTSRGHVAIHRPDHGRASSSSSSAISSSAGNGCSVRPRRSSIACNRLSTVLRPTPSAAAVEETLRSAAR